MKPAIHIFRGGELQDFVQHLERRYVPAILGEYFSSPGYEAYVAKAKLQKVEPQTLPTLSALLKSKVSVVAASIALDGAIGQEDPYGHIRWIAFPAKVQRIAEGPVLLGYRPEAGGEDRRTLYAAVQKISPYLLQQLTGTFWNLPIPSLRETEVFSI